MYSEVAPFAGAWIEIYFILSKKSNISYVAPFAGAWIEIFLAGFYCLLLIKSHPSRVRGLKLP